MISTAVQSPSIITGTPNSTVSGVVTDIAIDPSGKSDSTIYVATIAGGVWKTTNGGSNWAPLTDAMPSLYMGAVALDPGNSAIVYAGTGGPQQAGMVGIYASSHGGAPGTWGILNPTSTASPNGIFTGVNINRIVLPASGILLVATSNGLFKSVDGGINFGNNAPQFDNSLPIPISVGAGSVVSAGYITDLKLDTATSSTVYAAVRGSGIFKSIDSGSTFPSSGALFTSANLPSSITGFSNFVFAQSTQPNNQTFYTTVGVTNGVNVNPLCAKPGPNQPPTIAMFKSVSGGSWSRIAIGPEMSRQPQPGFGGLYDRTIGVDPQNANYVYMGMINLYLSTDGGQTGFRSFHDASNNGCPDANSQDNQIDYFKAHVDQHAIAFSPASHFTGAPGSPTRVFTGNDGGFATTSAQGSPSGFTWQLLNNGLATLLVNGMDIGRGRSAANAYTYTGAQDNGIDVGTRNPSGTYNWVYTSGGDGRPIAVDPLNHLHAFGTNDGQLECTTDGTDWGGCGGTLPTSCTNQGFGFLHFDPNGGVVYAGCGAQLLQSTNNETAFAPMNIFPQSVTAMAGVIGNPNEAWVGLANGTLLFTNNALSGKSATWIPVSVTGAPTGQPISGIAVDPTNPLVLVVVYSGTAGATPPQNVFIGALGGLEWKNISGVGGAMRAVVIVPTTSPHAIVVGGDYGVVISADMGHSWQSLGTGLPNVQVTSLALDATPSAPVLRASTFGRGVFELANPAPTVTMNVSPSAVREGSSAILSWSSTNATTCSTGNDWIGSSLDSTGTQVGNGGALPVAPSNADGLSTSYAYYITCTGLFGATATGSAFLGVDGPLGARFPGTCALPCNIIYYGTNLGEVVPFPPPGNTKTPGAVLTLQTGTVESVQGGTTAQAGTARRNDKKARNPITTITVSPDAKMKIAGKLDGNVRIVKAKIDRSDLADRLPKLTPTSKPTIIGVVLQGRNVTGLIVSRGLPIQATPVKK